MEKTPATAETMGARCKPRLEVPDREFIRVGSTIYRLIMADDPKIEDRSMFGVFDPNKFEIHIANYTPPTRTYTTFLHEVLHAIEWERNIELTEAQIDAISKGLVDFLIDNDLVVLEYTQK